MVKKSRCAMCVLASLATTTATADPLPIHSGTYVIQSYRPCAEAPLAGTFHYDGKGIAGPHESNCMSKLLSRYDRSYRIQTTCRALGDGTPAQVTASTQIYTVKSPTVVSVGEGTSQTTYALCPGFY
jgi:hypothetical protein